MTTSRKKRHASPAGKRLEEAIYARYDSIASFAQKLTETLDGTVFETVQATLSAMINGKDPERWNRKYFLFIERSLGVRMADIIDGTRVFVPPQPGLYEVGTQGNYKDFERLAAETDGSIEVIRSYDERSKSIIDYVYESDNIEGLRFLVDHDFYFVYSPGNFTANNYHSESTEEHALILLRLLAKDEDPEAKMFAKLLDSHEKTILSGPDNGIFWNETLLRFILGNERLLNAVCRKPDMLPESKINAAHRVVSGSEYEALCASNWLTPLLCYALEHEDEYHEQAARLLDVSLDVASDTLTRIGQNIGRLGGPDESITTKKGYVILGHHYVIGVIGEPMTDGKIKDPVLKKKAAEVTAKIGSFRAMAKYQTPVIIDGKMHLPPAVHNQLYSKFIDIAKGHRYLLQKADSKDGDMSNKVFIAPKGTTVNEFSLPQWRQIGQALHSIHQIDTGEEGKVFCHGSFYYSDFYILPSGKLEYISGYRNVHIGDYEEDIFAAGFLACNINHAFPEPKQEAIEAFLEGYGYPSEGFLEKLWNYLVNLAKKEDNPHEARFLMNSATGVLMTMKAMR